MTRKHSIGASSALGGLRPTCLALSLFLAAPSVGANESRAISPAADNEAFAGHHEKRGPHKYLKPQSHLADLLNHSDFKGFARLLLPWDDRHYDQNMRISNIGSLLPYHTNVDPNVVVSALNRMIDDANNGNTIFYEFYTPEDKWAEPARVNTGLFFFRGKPGAPFALVAPGGGFSYVGTVHEGLPYAAEISKAGYNVFVLKYRVGFGGKIATEDMAAALSYIFQNAAALGVSTVDYSLWGSSAGARMAAAISSHGATTYGGPMLPKPSTVVTAYTGHSDTSANEPPTFVVVGEQDGIAPPSAMERRIMKLRGAGVEVEYRKYHGIGHGFGVGSNTSAEGWVTEAVRFWEKFIGKGSP